MTWSSILDRAVSALVGIVITLAATSYYNKTEEQSKTVQDLPHTMDRIAWQLDQLKDMLSKYPSPDALDARFKQFQFQIDTAQQTANGADARSRSNHDEIIRLTRDRHAVWYPPLPSPTPSPHRWPAVEIGPSNEPTLQLVTLAQ